MAPVLALRARARALGATLEGITSVEVLQERLEEEHKQVLQVETKGHLRWIKWVVGESIFKVSLALHDKSLEIQAFVILGADEDECSTDRSKHCVFQFLQDLGVSMLEMCKDASQNMGAASLLFMVSPLTPRQVVVAKGMSPSCGY